MTCRPVLHEPILLLLLLAMNNSDNRNLIPASVSQQGELQPRLWTGRKEEGKKYIKATKRKYTWTGTALVDTAEKKPQPVCAVPGIIKGHIAWLGSVCALGLLQGAKSYCIVSVHSQCVWNMPHGIVTTSPSGELFLLPLPFFLPFPLSLSLSPSPSPFPFSFSFPPFLLVFSFSLSFSFL